MNLHYMCVHYQALFSVFLQILKEVLQSLRHLLLPSRRSALSLPASVSAATLSSSSRSRRLFRQDFLQVFRQRLHAEALVEQEEGQGFAQE